MSERRDTVWAAVRIERGFVVEVKAYTHEGFALRQERTWRSKMNMDYDETGVCEVALPAKFRRSK